jgi:hypothetical protein
VPTNDFLSFAGDPAANVMLQADYLATSFTPRYLGFEAGTAYSIQCNKVWRQASLISHMVAQYVCDTTGLDMLDDGSAGGLSTLQTHFTSAITLTARAAVGVGYLPLSGGTLTGPLTINTANPQVNINAGAGQSTEMWFSRPAGQYAYLAASTSGIVRWQLLLANADPETGANAGSNYQIQRFADNGTYLDSVITISRQTGVVNFAHPPTIQGGLLPYLPITGGTLSGYLWCPGIYYAYGSYAHEFQFYWDGGNTHVIVDNGDQGVLATQSYVGAVAGNYVPVNGGIIYNRFEMNCNPVIDGQLWCRSSVIFVNLGDYYIGTYNQWRIFNWAGSWWDGWNSQTGTRIWETYSGNTMQLDGSCNLSASGIITTYQRFLVNSSYCIMFMYNPAVGIAMGSWIASDGMWFGGGDGGGNPTQGMMRLDTGGQLCVWNGLTSYNYMQCSQWASVGTQLTVGDQLYVNNRAIIQSNGPFICTDNYSISYAVSMAAWIDNTAVYGNVPNLHIWNSDADGNPISTIMMIGQNGSVWVPNRLFQGSDRSFKTNIRGPEVDSLAAIRRLVPCSFDRDGIRVPLGYIADEVAPHLPDAVDAVEGVKYLDQGALLSHALNAIAQLSNRLEQMEAKLA